ncbi:uncharacterized protein BXZ73DRAFT_88467 [Epithele typhae]|uniref:uncharacterized protein n=1 Tax=Epithele typhae TaxID=378194 RepID=UPI0020084DA6|nr:uncharacterized protein BXZ73DRAFT_88467 [Epithele typhae]KAH9940720.1 hypothetical protein BXZ73DRAFT_88467 [Epithele typhae]
MSADQALSAALGKVTLQDNPSPVPPSLPASSPEPNPWQETTADTPVNHGPKDPDLSQLDPQATQGLAASPELIVAPLPPVKPEVLAEFDPLANAEEKEARRAWASSESHPPPPPLPDKDPSAPQPSAAATRTFALPISRAQSLAPWIRRLQYRLRLHCPRSPNSKPPQRSLLPMGSLGRALLRRPVGVDEAPIRKAKDHDPSQFDFQRFLDQMKMKQAEPVAKYLRSYVLGQLRQTTFTVNDQVKLINDFLNFIATRMRECELWRNTSEVEFDNAMEGMEKLVMNRLYDFTFTPQVARAVPPRPITTDDLERDRVLAQRIALFGWLEASHLDVPEGDGSEGFLMFAQQELLKINHYKAPRDKLICILNCCKVIFGLIRHLRRDEGADTFVPILIYIVIKANPPHLLSNVENPTKLTSEAGYYLSSLMGAVSFIETMDHTSLSNISQEEFERNVEEAIQSLPSTESQTPERAMTPGLEHVTSLPLSSSSNSHAGEESAQVLSMPAPTPGSTLGDDARRLLQKTGDTMSKPLSAISRIFNEVLDGAEDALSYLPGPFAPLELGREQQQQLQYTQDSHSAYPQTYLPQTPNGTSQGEYQPPLQTPYKPRVRRGSPAPSIRSASSAQFPYIPPTPGQDVEDTPTRFRAQSVGPPTNRPLAIGPSVPARPQHLQDPRVAALAGQDPGSNHVSRTPTPNLDIAGLQDEIDRAHEKAAVAARETLRQIFPSTDIEVVDWVLEANEGDLGKSIEALLEMSSGS